MYCDCCNFMTIFSSNVGKDEITSNAVMNSNKLVIDLECRWVVMQTLMIITRILHKYYFLFLFQSKIHVVDFIF